MIHPVAADGRVVVDILPSPANIIKRQVAEKHDITVRAIESRRRWKAIVQARQECMYRLRVELGLNKCRIGRILGGVDHTTVLYGIGCHALLHGLPYPDPGCESIMQRRPSRRALNALAARQGASA